MKQNLRSYLLFAGFFLSIIIGCSNPVRTPPVIHYQAATFDTTFSIGALSFPDSSVAARSVVSHGNLNRLHFFLAKANKGDSLAIGCIGGSVTEGAFAASTELRYVNRFAGFLQNAYPQSRFSVVNAGIGATNSRFGASRVAEDLLQFRPDLILIEYAVNDDPADSVGTVESLEGVVRQCLQLDSVPVVLLFTTSQSGDSITQQRHAVVGRQYELPIISYHHAIWPFIEQGVLSWSNLSSDWVHPNDDGHLAIGYLLYSFCKAVSGFSSADYSVTHSVPAPFTTDLFEHAHLLRGSDSSLIQITSSSWNALEKEYGRLGFKDSLANSMIVQTTCREMTLGYRRAITLDATVEIRIDGEPLDTLQSYFSGDWGGGYMQLATIFRQDNHLPHTITITNLDSTLFEIQYILFAE